MFYFYYNSNPEITIKEAIEEPTSVISLDDFMTPRDLDIYVVNVSVPLMTDVYILFVPVKVSWNIRGKKSFSSINLLQNNMILKPNCNFIECRLKFHNCTCFIQK